MDFPYTIRDGILIASVLRIHTFMEVFAVTKELTDIEQTIDKTKDQFVDAAKRATRELDRQRKRLTTELDRANARAARTRTQIQKEAERVATETASAAQREVKKQMRNLEKALKSARKDAERFRDDLMPVVDNLISARNHLAHALKIDRALASIQRELKRRPAEDRAKAKTVAKKAPVRKKVAKKAPARKKASKPVARKKPVVKQAPTDKAA